MLPSKLNIENPIKKSRAPGLADRHHGWTIDDKTVFSIAMQSCDGRRRTVSIALACVKIIQISVSKYLYI